MFSIHNEEINNNNLETKIGLLENQKSKQERISYDKSTKMLLDWQHEIDVMD